MQKDRTHTRHYVQVGNRLVHYRKTGEGPALIMQHASPLTSESLASAMDIFGEHFTCIALDNPGYGLSDPLPPDQRGDLEAHAKALLETLQALGVERPIIYGASTGGAITHMFGCLYPEYARMLMLDTFNHMDTADTVDGYFPDVEPREDGSQFLAYWNKLVRLFIYKPWQHSQADRRQIRDLPSAGAIHDMLLQQLSAGVGYKDLYRAAIVHEDNDNIPRLKARATINVWQGAASFDKIKAYLDGVLPDNYIPIASPLGPGGRYRNQLAWLLENGFGEPSGGPLIPAQDQSVRCYVNSGIGQIHLRHKAGTNAPIMLLHDWGRSARSFDHLFERMGSGTNVVIPDLPGHGDTPGKCSSPDHAIAETISALEDVIDEIGAQSISIVGEGGGALLGAALKVRRPKQVSALGYLASAPLRQSIDECRALQMAAKKLAPVHSGAHIIDAFDQARASEAFWHPEDRTRPMALAKPGAMDAERMHQTTYDTLRAPDDWQNLPLAAAQWLKDHPDAEAALNGCTCLVPDWHVGGAPLRQLVSQQTHCLTLDLPSDADKWGETISAVFAK